MAKIELPSFLRELGARLKKYRKERSLTQEELAELAGLNTKYYVQIESGKRNISLGIVMKIAEALELKPHELLDTIGHVRNEKDQEIISAMLALLRTKQEKEKNLLLVILQEMNQHK